MKHGSAYYISAFSRYPNLGYIALLLNNAPTDMWKTPNLLLERKFLPNTLHKVIRRKRFSL